MLSFVQPCCYILNHEKNCSFGWFLYCICKYIETLAAMADPWRKPNGTLSPSPNSSNGTCAAAPCFFWESRVTLEKKREGKLLISGFTHCMNTSSDIYVPTKSLKIPSSADFLGQFYIQIHWLLKYCYLVICHCMNIMGWYVKQAGFR